MFLTIQILAPKHKNLAHLKKVINFIKKHGDIKDVKALGSLIITPLITDQKSFLDSTTENYPVANQVLVIGRDQSHTEYYVNQYWSKGVLDGLLTTKLVVGWLGEEMVAVDVTSPKSLADCLRRLHETES
jgi:hypothetical protein